MKSYVSRPQRAMLANAIAGRPLEHGLSCSRASGPSSTVQALHRKGMLAGIDHQPTAAGRAALSPPALTDSAQAEPYAHRSTFAPNV